MINTRAISHSRGAMKILEVVLAVICIILWRQYDLNFGGEGQAGKDRYMVGMITMGGMLVVSGPLLLSYIRNPAGVQDKYAPFLESIYNSAGFILYLTVSCLVLTHYNVNKSMVSNNQAGLALGVISLINSIVYAIDASLAIQTLNDT